MNTHSNKFNVDSNKNLTKIVDGEDKFITKLSKSVFKMIEYEKETYFIDSFGDCFKITDQPKFLFGILSQPSFFSILNDKVYSVDKYSRVWVHSLAGEIINIGFVQENIIKCHFGTNFYFIATDGELNKINYYEEKEIKNERKLIIFNISFEILKAIEIDKIIEFSEDKVKYEKDNNIYSYPE